MGHGVGDRVEVHLPSGASVHYQVVEITKSAL